VFTREYQNISIGLNKLYGRKLRLKFKERLILCYKINDNYIISDILFSQQIKALFQKLNYQVLSIDYISLSTDDFLVICSISGSVWVCWGNSLGNNWGMIGTSSIWIRSSNMGNWGLNYKYIRLIGHYFISKFNQ
jgi:hypothetical protein